MPLPHPTVNDSEAHIEREALRLYGRYAVEVVENFGFCPWASEARRRGEVHVEVLLGEPDVEATLARMGALAKREHIAIALLVMPTAALTRLAFQHHAAALREADRLAAHPTPTAWAVADFHPAASADLGSPQRLVPFIRRTPDPTLQLVRHSVLQHIRKGEAAGTRFIDTTRPDWLQSMQAPHQPPLHARVAGKNLETVQTIGVEAVEKKIGEILDDRGKTYRRLGLPPSPWE